MNLVQGELQQGRFVAAPDHVDGIEVVAAHVILAVRPEDITVVLSGRGNFNAPAYTADLFGESVQVTLDTCPARLLAKADHVWRAEIGTLVGIKIDTRWPHIFNASMGMRMDSARICR